MVGRIVEIIYIVYSKFLGAFLISVNAFRSKPELGSFFLPKTTLNVTFAACNKTVAEVHLINTKNSNRKYFNEIPRNV